MPFNLKEETIKMNIEFLQKRAILLNLTLIIT